MERMLIPRELPTPHLTDVSTHRLGDHPLQISVAFHELGRKSVGQTEEVMDHQDLPITGGSGADANGRDRQPLGDLMGWVHRHPFEHDSKGTSLGYRLGILQQALPRARLAAGLLPLHLESTHAVDRLRGQTDMTHHWDVHVDDRLDHPRYVHPAL